MTRVFRGERDQDGSGPGQLAIAMLLAVTDTEEAERYYPLFRSGVLALIRGDRWTLPVDLGHRGRA